MSRGMLKAAFSLGELASCKPFPGAVSALLNLCSPTEQDQHQNRPGHSLRHPLSEEVSPGPVLARSSPGPVQPPSRAELRSPESAAGVRGRGREQQQWVMSIPMSFQSGEVEDVL